MKPKISRSFLTMGQGCDNVLKYYALRIELVPKNIVLAMTIHR